MFYKRITLSIYWHNSIDDKTPLLLEIHNIKKNYFCWKMKAKVPKSNQTHANISAYVYQTSQLSPYYLKNKNSTKNHRNNSHHNQQHQNHPKKSTKDRIFSARTGINNGETNITKTEKRQKFYLRKGWQRRCPAATPGRRRREDVGEEQQRLTQRNNMG